MTMCMCLYTGCEATPPIHGIPSTRQPLKDRLLQNGNHDIYHDQLPLPQVLFMSKL